MATEINVVIELHMDEADLVSLPDRLNCYFAENAGRIRVRTLSTWNETPETATYLERLNSGWLKDEPVQTWMPVTDGYCARQAKSVLRGPFGMRLYIGDQCCLLSTCVHWGDFVHDLRIQGDIRAFSQCLRGILAGSRTIFVPDDTEAGARVWSAVADGTDMPGILDLLASVEPPVRTLADTTVRKRTERGQSWEAAGYCIVDGIIE